jgi:predicted nucleotidyltransferase
MLKRELPDMAITQAQIDKIVSVAKAYGATRVILFGSSVESPQKANDLDLACDGVQGWKLYELASRLEEDLQTTLDIVPLTPPTRFSRLIQARGKILL